MLGRTPKATGGQGGERRQVRRTGSNPAFSYYTARSDAPSSRLRDEQMRGLDQKTPQKGQGGKKYLTLPTSFAQLPLWILLAVAVACVGKVLFLSTSPKIILLGSSDVTAPYVQPAEVYAKAAHKLLATSITNSTKITANTDGIATRLMSEFPELSSVSVALPLVSNRPVIYAQIARPSVMLQNGHGNYALNKNGLVLAKLHTVPGTVPAVADQSDRQPTPGMQFLPSSTVQFIQTIAYQLNAGGLKVSGYVLPPQTPYELDVRLQGQQYIVRYNLQADAATQAGATAATLQKIGVATPGEYLDVRVPGRVYYK